MIELTNHPWNKEEITVKMSKADALVLLGCVGAASSGMAEDCLKDVFGVVFDTDYLGCALYRQLREVVEKATGLMRLPN